MIRQFVFLVACLALVSIACKSGNKEVAETPMTDTTAMKAEPPVVADTAKTAEPAPANNQMTSTSGKTATTSTNTATTTSTSSAATNAPGAPDEKGYYMMPEKKPLYPGGEPAFNKYLADNLRYPPMAKDNHIQGTVYASLLVNEQGKIVDVSIVSKPLGYGLEEEVLRVIKAMPQWSPGEFNHHAVKTKFTLPVKFTLK